MVTQSTLKLVLVSWLFKASSLQCNSSSRVLHRKVAQGAHEFYFEIQDATQRTFSHVFIGLTRDSASDGIWIFAYPLHSKRDSPVLRLSPRQTFRLETRAYGTPTVCVKCSASPCDQNSPDRAIFLHAYAWHATVQACYIRCNQSHRLHKRDWRKFNGTISNYGSRSQHVVFIVRMETSLFRDARRSSLSIA